MNYSKGFTLIELLVAAGIISVLAIFSTQLVFDSITTRSKQYSIQDSSDNVRTFLSDITDAVVGASQVAIPNSSTVEITSVVCKSFRYNAVELSIESAIDASAACAPPTSGFTKITRDDIEISLLQFGPVEASPDFVTLSLVGEYKDSLGSHPFNYQTTLVPRIKL